MDKIGWVVTSSGHQDLLSVTDEPDLVLCMGNPIIKKFNHMDIGRDYVLV